MIRILLLVAGAANLANGLVMLLAPATWFFQLIPGVPDTGAFNAHLVADVGTFYVAIGAGLIVAARDPARHVVAVAVAAGASVLHAVLHLVSHAAGILSGHLTAEVALIYVPTAALAAMAIALASRSAAARA